MLISVKSETFSDQWHVRVYSHAARSSSRSSLFEDDRLTTADSGQRSRRIGHLSRVFPPWDVLSSLVDSALQYRGSTYTHPEALRSDICVVC